MPLFQEAAVDQVFMMPEIPHNDADQVETFVAAWFLDADLARPLAAAAAPLLLILGFF